MTRSALRRETTIMTRQLIAAVLLALLGGAIAPGAQEGVITRGEALAAVYPGATVTRDRVILTREQMAAVAAIARVGMQGRIFPRYIARNRDGAVVGRAYIDTHTPKTERQSLLISLDTEGRIKRVDVTVFFEPAQYMAPQDWLRQFDGQVLHDELAIRRGIRRIAGSSFTGRAISNAVRRVLALDQVLQVDAAQP
jgi:hypothetical protein